MVALDRTLISIAVDLSRLPDDPIAESQLSDILLVGREVDLLETIRVSSKDTTIPLELLKFQSTRLRIAPQLFASEVKDFEGKAMLQLMGDKIKLLFETSHEVYNYGLRRLAEIGDKNQIDLLQLISVTWRKPVVTDELYSMLSRFGKPYRTGLWNFFIDNKILIPFTWRNEQYLISCRLFKDEKKLRMALEILEENHLNNIVDFLRDNPGNPLPVASRHLNVNQETILLLGQYGIVDPLRLDVKGDTKEYLFSADSTIKRDDTDHFDLVKMTLANFRFGEYYSKKSKLESLDEFLSSMLDRGFAGWAEAIGTDYKNLENAGIIRVERVSGSFYRFWLVKKDVIADARDIVRGVIPIVSSKDVGTLADIENAVRTRRQIDVDITHSANKGINDAIRLIQEGMFS
jgi:hypothetical protein